MEVDVPAVADRGASRGEAAHPGVRIRRDRGGTGASGYNPFIHGDNDGTVSVASTRLAGAADFVVVDRLHTFIISAPETAEYTAHFLKTGRFRTVGDAEPVPREDVAGTARSTGRKEP